ncbi:MULTISPECIES: glycosyltransferase family 4 protein [Inquilinus]|uniref:Glycosyltransferase involved in cell wall biosynthesis n=1 Tax=Inquilinus ginsengisoli TaxID=363840 RepID=A0ABU1JPY0_9PROT|nr:glycosyltransferase family 1 protein [Inquilinus ginsengisoli]MDR6290677.1 glycosyltransferase involved in cell wall biosynthesis [Inquilinus ginsengisoli]
MAQDQILFDATRLVRRSGSATPTGVDRVELTYAGHMLDRYPNEVQFIARWRSRYWQLSTPAFAQFVASRLERWSFGASRVRGSDAERIARFIGVPSDQFNGRGRPQPLLPAPRPSAPLLQLGMDALMGARGLLSRMISISARKNQSIYVNVSHEGLHQPTTLQRLVLRRKLAPIYLVHDLIPIDHPEYVRPGHAERHAARIEAISTTAAATIVNSMQTKRDLLKHVQRYHGNMDDVFVAPLGVDRRFAPQKANDLESEPYFLIIGTIEPRKNHLFMLQVWRALVQKLGAAAPKLVIVGRRGWENENVIDMIERCDQIGDHVIECGRVPDAVLHRLLLGARAVLFPSFAEGYGLPLVEGLSSSVPVICSDLPVFHELGSGIPEYLDPLDGPGWMEMIIEYSKTNSLRRQAQMARLARFKAPTWDRHFGIFDEVVEDVRRKYSIC